MALNLDRELFEVFEPRPTLDLMALSAATDLYCSETGDVDDLAFAAGVLIYLEAVHEARYQASKEPDAAQ